MKFMVTWSVYPESWLPILQTWSSMTPDERADGGSGVTIVGRWHDSAGKGGVAIMEASDNAALQTYLGQWAPYMSLTVIPVLDDEESASLAATVVAAIPS